MKQMKMATVKKRAQVRKNLLTRGGRISLFRQTGQRATTRAAANKGKDKIQADEQDDDFVIRAELSPE